MKPILYCFCMGSLARKREPSIRGIGGTNAKHAKDVSSTETTWGHNSGNHNNKPHISPTFYSITQESNQSYSFHRLSCQTYIYLYIQNHERRTTAATKTKAEPTTRSVCEIGHEDDGFLLYSSFAVAIVVGAHWRNNNNNNKYSNDKRRQRRQSILLYPWSVRQRERYGMFFRSSFLYWSRRPGTPHWWRRRKMCPLSGQDGSSRTSWSWL